MAKLSKTNTKIDFRNCDYKIIVKQLKKNSTKIDLVLTDPPYCVSRNYQLGFSNMGRFGMNYGEWDYNFNQTSWLKEVCPLIRSGGSIIIFNDWMNFSYLIEVLEKEGFFIKDLIRWEKSNPMPRNVNSRYVSDCEMAIWAVKGNKKWTFNKPKNVSYLKPVFKTGIVLGKGKRIHPTQKSLKLFEWIITIHSNEGDLVFDPFSGSGTTAVACKNKNRRFIGSEIDAKYFKKAKKRLW